MVCRVEELAPGGCRSVAVDGRSVCVVNVDGRFHAVRDVCPHQGASLCAGTLGGTMVASRPQEYRYVPERSILRCPWHGWEFDVRTGRSLFDPNRIRVATYDVEVDDGYVVLAAWGGGAP